MSLFFDPQHRNNSEFCLKSIINLLYLIIQAMEVISCWKRKMCNSQNKILVLTFRWYFSDPSDKCCKFYPHTEVDIVTNTDLMNIQLFFFLLYKEITRLVAVEYVSKRIFSGYPSCRVLVSSDVFGSQNAFHRFRQVFKDCAITEKALGLRSNCSVLF